MNGIKQISIFFLLITSTTLFGIYCSTKSDPAAPRVKASFEVELAKLRQIVDGELSAGLTAKNEAALKKSFLHARSQYKQLEYYMEYFFPTTAVLINGAPIDEIELGENLVEQPTGFQVMEELIYEEPNAENRELLANEINKMKLNLARVARYNAQYEITDEQIFDAMRLEVFRITSLGITGFDTPTALQSLPEAAAALNGIKSVLSLYGAEDALSAQLEQAISVLKKSPDFNALNRLDFITKHLQVVSAGIDKLRRKLQISPVSGSSAMSDEAISLFQKDALDVKRFVGNHTEYPTKAKIELGKLLFNSKVLSNAGNRSCASCHHEGKAFTDGLRTASGMDATALLRNTPTLLYAGFQRGFFYDLKAGSLEDQALDVVHHKQEMDGSLKAAAARINRDSIWTRAFRKAYGTAAAQADPWKIQHALATYIRSLAPFSSRVDRYMRGEQQQLHEEEKQGFNLFMGKAKCGSCHFAPLFNGTQSPMFAKTEAEVLGVPNSADTAKAVLDRDEGRFALSPYPQYKYAFKTTTLRNVSKTAPYMHNGVYNSLEEVLDFYNRGGGAGIGISLENQTLSADPLNLSKKEMQQIIAFLKALED